ncbi:acetyltransferase [Cladorrhinum sp. PSN332]|nr:acetyltransferase [Cladorrhinum sp. PSN332]
MTSSSYSPSVSTTTTIISFPTPIITTPNFQIRAYHDSDITPCTEALNSNASLIAKYMRNTFPNPATTPGTRHWIKICTTCTIPPNHPSGTLINYAIVSGDEFIGSIGFKPMPDIESRTFEIGYWIRYESWGKGIMTAAVRKFVRWAFETFPDLERIEAQVFDDNEASVKVLTKAGLLYEGTRRKAGYKPSLGGAFDIRMFGVTRDDVLGHEKRE